MSQAVTRNPLRRAARKVGGALGRFFYKIVIVGPSRYDVPVDEWPRFPPF